jgi:hypothetical protein
MDVTLLSWLDQGYNTIEVTRELNGDTA